LELVFIFVPVASTSKEEIARHDQHCTSTFVFLVPSLGKNSKGFEHSLQIV
jgi:hypothetical protein